jgi:hypothetical protein
VGLEIENCSYVPDVLDGERLGEERVEDSDGLGPVPRAAELGELDSLGDSWAHELTRTSWVELSSADQKDKGVVSLYGVPFFVSTVSRERNEKKKNEEKWGINFKRGVKLENRVEIWEMGNWGGKRGTAIKK